MIVCLREREENFCAFQVYFGGSEATVRWSSRQQKIVAWNKVLALEGERMVIFDEC